MFQSMDKKKKMIITGIAVAVVALLIYLMWFRKGKGVGINANGGAIGNTGASASTGGSTVVSTPPSNSTPPAPENKAATSTASTSDKK